MEILKQPRMCVKRKRFFLRSGPIAKDSTHTTHWTWRSQDGSYMESSPLHLASWLQNWSQDWWMCSEGEVCDTERLNNMQTANIAALVRVQRPLKPFTELEIISGFPPRSLPSSASSFARLEKFLILSSKNHCWKQLISCLGIIVCNDISFFIWHPTGYPI